jgi:hypothetical protein
MEERLRAMDPDIDLAEGSPAYDQVIEPTVQRYTPDPFEVDLEKFVDARLAQEHPELNIKEGSGLRDALVKPMQILMDPVHREVKIMKQNQSLANPELLSPDDADSLVANVFVSRSTGGLANGTVRLYFNAPVALTISIGNVCYTSSGLRFIPTTLQSITAEAMVFNQSGSLYYFDIQVTAEKAGDEYNVDKNNIVGITNLNAAVRVTNLEKFDGGVTEQSTDDLVIHAEQSITERSLVVGRGVAARLYDTFEALKHLQVVGFTDAEMMRDIITGGNRGPILYSGNGGYTEDDGDGDVYSYRFRIRDNIDFINDVFGGAGTVSNYWLSLNQVHYGTNAEVPFANLDHFILSGFQFVADDVGRIIVTFDAANPENVGVWQITGLTGTDEVSVARTSPGVNETGISWIMLRPDIDVEIDSVVTATELKLKGRLPVDLPVSTWAIRKKEISISEIPGGITSIADAEALSVESDELHIGGCTDFYVRGTSVDEEDLTVEAISDESPVVADVTLNTSSVDTEFVSDNNYDFVRLGVKPGMSLVIEAGADAGVKTILRAGVNPSGTPSPYWLQVEPPLTSTASGVKYKIVDEIDVDLRQPRTMRGVGTDLQTLQLSDTVTTASAQDFDALGTEVGDTLRILTGPDKGDYSILAITGTGSKSLQISGQLTSTSSNVGWEVFKAGDGINFPMIRISSLDILDSSQQPTGNTIPYSEPVDAQSTAFANSGRGVKVSTTDGITGIVGTRDLTPGAPTAPSYPLPTTTLDISINDAAPITATLTGATTPEGIVNIINGTAGLFNIADLLTVDGEVRLVLRSTDRWIKVDPGASLVQVGLDVTNGEDSRQIKSLNNITDWTDADYNLALERDSVYITTGDNTGFFHLVAVETGRILVVGVDEESGRVTFPHPNVRVSLRVGSRSYGKARVYFLDPTSFQVQGGWRPPLKNTTDFPANEAIGKEIPVDERPLTYFTATVNGASLRFVPDPDLKHSVLPASGDSIPNNLDTTGASELVVSNNAPSADLGKNSRDSKVDFLDREVLVGDLVEITHVPIQGDKDMDLLTLPADLKDTTLILSVDGAPRKTHTFTDQLSSVDDIISEINATFGLTLAYKETFTGPSKKLLRLEADVDVIWHKDSTCNNFFWTSFGGSNKNNQAPANINGYYTVVRVTETGDPTQHHKLEIQDAGSPVASSGQAQHFKVFRPGMQRIHSTDMALNTEIGLYYMDVELVSEGPGDEWNLEQDTLFAMTGYESDGYRLDVTDSDLSYSEDEEVMLVVSRRILTVGQSDRPDQATKLSLQNIQVNYDRSSLAASIQSFAKADLERVLNASILVRHLQPHYLNFEMSYRGGSAADVVQDDVLDYLDELGPEESVEVSDLQKLATQRGATYVQNPITLVAVTHDEDRTIAVVRSQDYVSRGRLATFFAEDITIERETVEVL